MQVTMQCMKYVILFTIFAMNLVDQPAPEVTIEQGILSGKISADGTFFEYTGIPYATTNRSNRFKAPLPPPSWEGVYKATEEMYYCPQITRIGIIGTEDCLKINVYVPALARKPLPVIVYIHGGAFVFGNGGKLLYGPEFLVKHDVIVVTFNYRLGALGFICLGIEEAPGNAGLKDQIAALRWIKKNIAAFGGDPDNVTLFGESAGGTSTALLTASEAATGLFHRAIVQSGSALANWAVNRNPIWTASLLAKKLGYNIEDPHEIYKILSELPHEDLINTKAEKPLLKFLDTDYVYLPCIEKSFPGVEAVLPDLPIYMIRNKTKNMPVMYGSTSKEGVFFIDDENDLDLEIKNYRYLFATDLEFASENETAIINKIVKQFYFGEDTISMKTILNILDLYTALYFEVPAILESELLIPVNKAPVYNYYFNYNGGRNLIKSNTNFDYVMGASHGDDLFYIFDARICFYQGNKKDKVIIDWMTTMWTNFAKYGDPTPAEDSKVPIKWEPSNKNELKFLYVEDELKMGPLPNPKQYKLWKDIYTKYRRTNLNFINNNYILYN